MKPKVGVYIKPEDIARAKERIRTEAWAKREYEAIIRNADYWMQFPESWFREILPPQGSTFSYGKTGCPVCGESWPAFGAQGVADLNRPKVLKCRRTGQLIDFDNPDSPYYDPDKGVTIDGVRYYLRGVWNAYVVQRLVGWAGPDGAVHHLTYAYVLSGNEAYADRALAIMDGLATLIPTTIGPRDFQRSETSVEGRLHWLTSIVHRAKMHLVNVYDLLYHVDRIREVSPTNPTNFGKTQGGFTIRENIEENILKDYVFEHFDLRDGKLSTLHNHEADEFRAMLAVGIVLEIPDWVRWAFDGVLGFLDNTIDRDGIYYETSLGYGNFAQDVYLDVAELLYNYDKRNHTNPDMPDKRQYPYGLNLYDHPKLKRFIVGLRQRVDAAGRQPAYGNANSPKEPVLLDKRPVTEREWNQMEKFHARTASEEDRAVYAQWLRDASNGDIESMRSGLWNLFHARDVAPGPHADGVKDNTETDLLGLTGLAILRSGEGVQRRAVLFRGGLNMPHAHDDLLGLLIHAKGYEITGDHGYGTFGSPVHLGWSSRQIAHNVVVVDQGQPFVGRVHQLGPGGDLLAFYKARGVSFVEMSTPHMFDPPAKVEIYRRGVALVDVSDSDSYIVDLFRVGGGTVFDYSFHTMGSDLEIAGAQPEPKPGVWTLWGLTEPDATFNAPGRSWGERIIAGEHIKSFNIPSEKVATRFWMPHPGNGYGFVHDLRIDKTDRPFTATWKLHDEADTRLSLTMLPQKELQVMQGKGPDLMGTKQLGYLIVRSEPEDGKTLFQAVIEPYTGPKPLVARSETLPLIEAPELSTAIKVTLADGRVDYILSVPDAAGSLQAHDGERKVAIQGGWGLIRCNPEGLFEIHLAGAAALSWGEWTLQLEAPARHATVVDVDHEKGEITVEGKLPEEALAGERLIISNPVYTHNSHYPVVGSRQDGNRTVIEVGESALSLSRVVLAELTGDGSTIVSKIPLPLGFQYQEPTRFFDGKRIVNETRGTVANVQEMTSRKEIRLAEPVAPQDFQVGDSLIICDVQPGDTVTVLSRAFLRVQGNQIEIESNQSCWLTVPPCVGASGVEVWDSAAKEWRPLEVVDGKVFIEIEGRGSSPVSLRVGR